MRLRLTLPALTQQFARFRATISHAKQNFNALDIIIHKGAHRPKGGSRKPENNSKDATK